MSGGGWKGRKDGRREAELIKRGWSDEGRRTNVASRAAPEELGILQSSSEAAAAGLKQK